MMKQQTNTTEETIEEQAKESVHKNKEFIFHWDSAFSWLCVSMEDFLRFGRKIAISENSRISPDKKTIYLNKSDDAHDFINEVSRVLSLHPSEEQLFRSLNQAPTLKLYERCDGPVSKIREFPLLKDNL